MKKNLAGLLVLCLIAVSGLYYYFAGKEYVYRFTENQLHETLSAKLPMTRSYLLIFQVTLANPRIALTEGSDRVGAGLDVVLNVRVGDEPKPLGGTIDIESGVKYEAATGQFFLAAPNITQLAVQGIPDKYTEKARTVLTKAITEYYSEHPIYSLTGADVKKAAARLVLKRVVVEGRELLVTLGI